MDRLECTCREGIQSKIVENGINVIEIKGNEKGTFRLEDNTLKNSRI